MLVIGLTGGIGSGKTTTAQFFADLGVPVIDADLIARTLTDKLEICQQLSEHFGPSILKADQSLDRQQLRQIIFNNLDEKVWLEQLLHPLIMANIINDIQQLKSSYCLVVIPLLLETGPYPFIDRILVIESPEKERLERAQKRDQTSAEDIQKIIQSQASPETRSTQKDDFILNAGNLEDLKKKVNELHQAYLELSETYL